MINNQPQANKNVTLRLYRMDSSQSVLIDEMTQTTDSNGNAKFVFDGMKDLVRTNEKIFFYRW